MNIIVEEPKSTPEERLQLIVYMTHAADVFYAYAQRIGVHEFLEFTGLMREYVKICEATAEAGGDFAADGRLAMKPDHGEYLAEKLDCIYGRAFAADPSLRRAFVEAFLGKEAAR